MAFDENKFLNAKYRDRTADVQVPELKKYFAEDEKPVWVVRGLTAEEIARANDEVSQNLDISAIVTALVSQGSKEKAAAVNDLVGLSKDTVPGDIVKRISHLVYGSVNPECSRELAVKLGRDHSVVFFKLTNKILELSGKGRLGE
jgi:hypothetical protein